MTIIRLLVFFADISVCLGLFSYSSC